MARAWKLDLGCGRRKEPGFIGLDSSRGADVDVVGDLGQSLPFSAGIADEVRLSHVFEHVANPVGVLEEVWRVCRQGAHVEIRGPHFSSPNLVWGDPTHRRGLSLATFRCFTDECDWYITKVRFSIESCRLVKGDTSFGAVAAKPWYWPLVLWNKTWERWVNRNLAAISRYERLIARLVAFQEVRVVLVAEKDCKDADPTPSLGPPGTPWAGRP